MIIDIDLSEESINRAIKELNKFAKDLEPKMDKACREIAEIAQAEAQKGFDGYSGPDGNTVYVEPPVKLQGGGYQVLARGAMIVDTETLAPIGNEVIFEEFGSGTAAGGHPLAQDFGVYPGSWSESEYGTGAFVEFGQWKYKRKRYNHIAGTFAMYFAGRKMKVKAKEIVRRVFK